MMIDFTTIAQEETSCYRSVYKMLIVNSEQWSEFWVRNNDGSFLYDDSWLRAIDCIPEIDFDYYNVIVVVAGEKATTEYVTEILSVETSSSLLKDRPSILITFRCKRPDSNRLECHTVTCPYHIIKIPKIDADKVVFKEV